LVFYLILLLLLLVIYIEDLNLDFTDSLNKGLTISELNKVLSDATTKLDYSVLLPKIDTINKTKTDLDASNKNLTSIIVNLNTLIGNINKISDTCVTYVSDLPFVQTALDNINTVLTDTTNLNTFLTGLPVPTV
jgi:hypothetical protein